jgi:peptidoglycan/LPS O-acetylase OafA/YrhL
MASPTKPDNAARQASQTRLVALDGMRGLAAVVVFAHHALALLYAPLAGINPQHHPLRPHAAAMALQTLPVGWMFNGAFAVSFFFVLSGFVLTLAAGTTPTPERMARLMSTRLLRLVPLVAIGTLGGFALFHLGVHGLDMLQFIDGDTSTAYIAKPLLEHHAWTDALRQMAVTIWGGAAPASLFDPPLWSIGVELQGSLYIFMLATVFAHTKRSQARYWVGAPVGLCLMGTSALCFLMGMYLAERLRDESVILPWPTWGLHLSLAAVLVWASVHPWNPGLWLPLPFPSHDIVSTLINAAMAALLLACGLQIVGLRRVLMTTPVRLLGEASYGLYVVHMPLLYVATAPLLHFTMARMGYNGAAVLTASLLLAVSAGVGWALVRYVDAPMARWSKRLVANWLAV